MRKPQLCAAALGVAGITTIVSIVGAPRPLSASTASTDVLAVSEAEPNTAVPALALVAAGGLLGAFALGVAQGYLECKNEQNRGDVRRPDKTFAKLDPSEFDYVLN